MAKNGDKNKNALSNDSKNEVLMQTSIDDFLSQNYELLHSNKSSKNDGLLQNDVLQNKAEDFIDNKSENTQPNIVKDIKQNRLLKKQEKLSRNKSYKSDLAIKAINQQNSNAEADDFSSIENQRKKLDEIEQSVSKQNSKKSKILNLVFFLVNICVVAGILTYQLLQEDFTPIEGFRIDVASLLLAILFFALTVSAETLCISYLIKQSTGKWRLGLSYKTAEIGRYYDSVTPMSTGGQPFQITYLKKRGMPLHTSLSIPLAKYVFNQIAWVILSLVCLIVSFTNKNFGTFVSITSILGFVLSSIMLFITIFLSVCKSLGRKIVVKVLRLLQKIKIVKNYDKQYEKITKYIGDFQDVMKQYAKSPKDFIAMLFFSLLKLFFNYSIPFFVARLFMPNVAGDMFFNLFVMTTLVDLSSSFFPLPGGTGLNEISFSAAFIAVMGPTQYLVYVLLVWRFFSYYIYLLQGICILSYDVAYGNKKYKWEVIRNNLAEESRVFKQNQINKFRAERARRRVGKQKNNSIKEYL